MCKPNLEKIEFNQFVDTNSKLIHGLEEDRSSCTESSQVRLNRSVLSLLVVFKFLSEVVSYSSGKGEVSWGAPVMSGRRKVGLQTNFIDRPSLEGLQHVISK